MMLVSFRFMLAYVLGGLTMIPLTGLLLYSLFIVYIQVYKPLTSAFRLYFTSASSKGKQGKRFAISDGTNEKASLFERSSTNVTHNDDMPPLHSDTTSAVSLYKVGWLKVLTQEEQSLLSLSIGLMVKNYISTSMNKQRGGDGSSITSNSNINNDDNHMYFSVLKYNTLYLYDSEKQLDCKEVINLSQYTVQMHPPGLKDFELYSKPNLIKLVLKEDEPSSTTITATTATAASKEVRDTIPREASTSDTKQKKSYFINCSKCIDKEDWYCAFLHATNTSATTDKTHFEQAAMNDLIKTVYSNEHHFQTQWFNALFGRIFLGIYRTKDIQHVLYKKVITKLDKINAKRPPFLGEITVRSVDPGHGIPAITQPKLLNLSPTGEMTAEAYLQYRGAFRIEIETVLVWKYSDRLKPLTIDLVLSITLNEIKGKLAIKIKEPPTNRFWYGFYECPSMDWKVEPVVWEKRVGYSVVVKAIESKIQELIVETMVIPHFDDITFFPTEDGVGGIFEKKTQAEDIPSKGEHNFEPQTSETASSAKESLSVKSAPIPIMKNKNNNSERTSNNNKLKKEERQQQKVKDEALITTARSLPELFSSAVPDRSQNEQLCRSSTTLNQVSTKNFDSNTQQCEPTKKPTMRQQSSYVTENVSSSDSSITTSLSSTSSSDHNTSNILLLANSNSLSASPDDSYLSSSPSSMTTDDRISNNTNLLSRKLTVAGITGIDDTQTVASTITTSNLIVTPSNSTSLLGTSSDFHSSTVHVTYSEIDEKDDDSIDSKTVETGNNNKYDNSEKQQPRQQRVRKQSSLALLRPKTVASTAIDVSPAMRL
ncbi:putative integral membrane protein conserved region-domain-containing protein [Mycotypha africana]|uniref:putative integral membrane protein conserved region-domain-containing protein n=1 Tax=Mycotypha africana TaxID=64632 RepID=UPI00230173BE|nr:putative integral membrane protein conserved region-domain-containing protein [Mycotypha africana]KAI8987484.1 putative integral membrane protein conserved region-domain-containing protein [Mycotypha africana]